MKLVVSSSLLKRLLPATTPKPVLPEIDPVIMVVRPPLPTAIEPLPEIVTSPPDAVPALADLPASRNTAALLAFVVLIALVTAKFASVTKLTVPPFNAIV